MKTALSNIDLLLKFVKGFEQLNLRLKPANKDAGLIVSIETLADGSEVERLFLLVSDASRAELTPGLLLEVSGIVCIENTATETNHPLPIIMIGEDGWEEQTIVYPTYDQRLLYHWKFRAIAAEESLTTAEKKVDELEERWQQEFGYTHR